MDQVRPAMGSGLVITVFAVVVIGGMGSILGSAIVGVSLGAAGSLFQLLLRNPLASPDIVGVSLGASAAGIGGGASRRHPSHRST